MSYIHCMQVCKKITFQKLHLWMMVIRCGDLVGGEVLHVHLSFNYIFRIRFDLISMCRDSEKVLVVFSCKIVYI